MNLLPGYPQHPEHVFTATLGGAQFRFRFVYRPRLGAWYFDLFDAVGTALVRARRVSAGWAPLFAIPLQDGPAGFLWVRGDDNYAQSDLGDALRVVFYATDEIPVAADDGDVIVELGA